MLTGKWRISLSPFLPFVGPNEAQATVKVVPQNLDLTSIYSLDTAAAAQLEGMTQSY